MMAFNGAVQESTEKRRLDLMLRTNSLYWLQKGGLGMCVGGGSPFPQVKREGLQGHNSEGERCVLCNLGVRRGMQSHPAWGI